MKPHKNSIAYIAVIASLSFASFISINLFFAERNSSDKININTLPYKIGQWQGTDLEITEREYDILETKNLILRQYANQANANENISLFVIYSETNRSVFHPPEVCLIGSGVKIIDKQTENVDFNQYNFLVNKIYAEKNQRKDLILYCYKVGKLNTSNYYLQQAYFALQQVFGKPVKGATIRVSMPITENGEEYSLTALKAFLRETVKIVDSL